MEGNGVDDIERAFTKTYPGVNFERTLTAAMDHFRTVSSASHDVLLGWCLESLREMHRRMVESGDYAGALKAIKELMRFACSRHDHQVQHVASIPRSTSGSRRHRKK